MPDRNKNKVTECLKSYINSPIGVMSKKIVNNRAFVFILGGILGILIFIRIFGLQVLDFTNMQWLMRGGDPTQHFLGWRFFRSSGWHFPFGLIDNIVYPNMVSIIYTDSIPLFAILFKLLSPFLPESFQYFGLFGVLCFFLQGAISGTIIKKLCGNSLYAIIGSMFFIMFPAMSFRMYMHTTLGAHFIILLCFYVCLFKENRSNIKSTVMWIGIICLAVTIHIYYIPVVMLFLLIYAIDDFIVTKKAIKPLLVFFAPAVTGIFILFLLGAFYGGSSSEDWGLGSFSANINAMLNPMDRGAYLKTLRSATSFQYEGYSYLGFGILLGLFITVISAINNFNVIKNSFKDTVVIKKVVLTAALFLILFVFALSPVVTFNERILFTYRVPGFIESIWSIFRASGRFMWTPAYIVILIVLWAINKEYKVNISIIVLSVLLLIQYSDLSGFMDRRGVEVKYGAYLHSVLESSAWDELAEHHERIVYLNTVTHGGARIYSIAELAADNRLTLSDFPVARKDWDAITVQRDGEMERIVNGQAAGDTIYLFENVHKYKLFFLNVLVLYEIDDFIVGLKNEFEFSDKNIKPFDIFDSLNILDKRDHHRQNAELLDDGGILLFSDGGVWSNYMDLMPGKYRFIFYGDNFEEALFDVSYEDGSKSLDVQVVGITDYTAEFLLILDQFVHNVHASCYNPTDADIIVDLITVEKFH